MRLYNADHQTAVIDPDKPGVQPGDSYDFTKEQIEAGLTGVWSETDPRKGLKQEKAFKGRRDNEQKPATPADTEPAEPETKE